MRKLAAALAALCFGLTATQTFAAPNAMTASGVTLANYSTSALTTVTVSMTMNFWYDVDDGTDTGYIDVTFPAGFDLSGIAASSYNSVTADSNWTYTISAPTSSTARLRFHTFNWVQPGQVRTFKIPNVRNPSTAGATGAFSVLGSGYDDNTSLPATVSQTASAVTIITSTTTTLASSSPANTSTYGGSVTLTATVSPSPSGGTVSFKDGATSLCSTVALTGGVATCTTSALTAGTHATIRATYSGNGASATSTSSFLSQTINKRPLSVIANPATRLYGAANPTLTATLIGFVNGQNLATSGATGSASVTTAANPSTPVGAAVLTAAQGSLAAVNYSFTYQTGTLTIGKAPLSVSASPASRVFGAVEPAFLPTYSGFVNGEVLSTSGVAGIPVLTTITTSSSPVASYAINVGLGTLVAANYQVSVVNGVLTVSQASTAIALSSGSAGDASTYGDSVTLTAQVTAVAPGSGLPTGSVTFSDGVATLGSGALDGSARATYTTGATQLGGGARSLTAAYGGASEFLTSTSPTLTQIVALASQTITFSALADKLSTDAPFTLSASAAPGLVVSFSSSTTSVCTVSGVTVTLIGGGTCTVTAAQTGSNNYLAATSVSHSFAVSAPQTITFAAPTSRTYGDASFSLAATASSGLDVTFASTSSSVCVTTGAHGATLSIVAAGTCSLVAAQSGSSAYLAATDVPQQFTLARAPLTIVAIDASRVYGQANPAFSASFSGLVNSDTSSNLGGTLTFGAAASSSSPPARYSVTPAGLTSGNYSISFGAGVLTVTRASSGVVLTPSSVTPVAGQVVTLKAQVSAIVPGAGLSTGVVTFKDGVTVLGAAALDGTGQASQSTVALVDGASHSFIASYAGDGNFTPADSSTVTLAVGQAATLTTLSSPSGGATTYGTPVTVYADIAVVAPGAAAFSGTVTFMDGAAILGTASVDGSGRAALAASGTQLVAGAHSIGALFSGSDTLGASSAAVFPLVVGPGPSSVALTTGVPNAVASVGQPVGLTAVVSGASTPSGSVAFNDGATTLGAGQLDGHGSATFTSGPLQLGIGGHDLTATYSGNADLHGSDSSAVSVQVVQATTVTSLVGGPN
ncbi:MAG TPA: Ig-like domain repeat protein, partial [Chloroflexota bacterium]|nr:Ig-like domain repeat protein [Chloroflexota bacterium]